MELRSGPALTDRLYWTGFLLVAAFFCGWFAYDGAYRYKNQNKKQGAAWVRQNVPGVDASAINWSETPSKEQFQSLRQRQPTDIRQVHEVLGAEPAFQRTDTVTGDTTEYYPTVFGCGVVTVSGGIVKSDFRWYDWTNTKDKTDQQYYCSAAVGVLMLWIGYRCIKANTLSATIDATGMTYGGVRIPFESMVSLRDYSPRGWVDLYYKDAGGVEKKLRIDNQKILKFNAIVDRLVEMKGFEHPLRAYEAAKAAED